MEALHEINLYEVKEKRNARNTTKTSARCGILRNFCIIIETCLIELICYSACMHWLQNECVLGDSVVKKLEFNVRYLLLVFCIIEKRHASDKGHTPFFSRHFGLAAHTLNPSGASAQWYHIIKSTTPGLLERSIS